MRITGIISVREAYTASLVSHGHEEDPAQVEIVRRLDDLQQRLLRSRAAAGLARLLPWQSKGRETPVKGLYLWGSVGRGKTFLMDLFYDTLPIDSKQRIHFHRMLRDVHERMASLGDIEDPLDRIGADIARSTRVLCFDEFFVSDIGDAMILGRLLESLFAHGVTLVATSNTPPDELYKDGLQRERFVPAIRSLVEHTDVVEIGGDTDYRLRLLSQAGTYLTPDDDSARTRLEHLFRESASSQIAENVPLSINGREIRARRCAKGIAWFDFADICDGPRSQNDYIEIARWYPTVIVSGVPRLDSGQENQARRFISLIDEFYDRRVKLLLSAAVPADQLYDGERLSFEFDRTVSRLVEMQSTDYLALPHLA
jgi:cell division protein ZapE